MSRSGDKTGGKRVAEFIDDLVRIGVDELATQGKVPADIARSVMRGIADRVCQEYARRDIYVPASFDPRNRDILRKYQEPSRTSRACSQGRVYELAEEYALSTRWVYELVRKSRLPAPAAGEGPTPDH